MFEEHETHTACQVPLQSMFIAKYLKESITLLFEAMKGLHVTKNSNGGGFPVVVYN